MKKKGKKPTETAPEEQPPKEDHLGDLQRIQAEFENYKKRTDAQQAEFRARASEKVLLELIPTIDNIALALQNQKTQDEFTKGIELIYAQLLELLKTHSVERMQAAGKTFDARKHEALMTKEAKECAPNTIIEVIQDGYVVGERVLRTAKVIVGK